MPGHFKAVSQFQIQEFHSRISRSISGSSWERKCKWRYIGILRAKELRKILGRRRAEPKRRTLLQAIGGGPILRVQTAAHRRLRRENVRMPRDFAIRLANWGDFIALLGEVKMICEWYNA